MGVRFHLFNKTKNQSVSAHCDEWKGTSFCDCHSVMHRYKWEISDDIYSFGSIIPYNIVHNEKKNIMYIVEMSDICEKSVKKTKGQMSNHVLVHKDDLKKNIPSALNLKFMGCKCKRPKPKEENTKTKHVSCITLNDLDLSDFDYYNNDDSSDSDDYSSINNHAPIWNGNICVICNYKYSPNNVKNDIPKKKCIYCEDDW